MNTTSRNEHLQGTETTVSRDGARFEGDGGSERPGPDACGSTTYERPVLIRRDESQEGDFWCD